MGDRASFGAYLTIVIYYCKTFITLNLFHGLLDAVEVGGDALVQVGVVELSVPLPLLRARQNGQFGIAALDEGEVLKVLGDGGVVEGSAVILKLKILTNFISSE